ncbi:hypothetical protein DHEL01_v205982 [Diaporthe helianthi]|uniref:F-box domain-containing protein n=1 Tax=Diaporthe helianthi TaxID=158607 RepID=A0A2P5HZE9_DIAHE|nr:hypothetical protein DHEL01_v205982 [Diaporthe helianthi]
MDTSNSQSPLEITELLELVLRHLDRGKVLQLQQVSRFWLQTISESPLLQQKLFFQPLPPSKTAGRDPEFNPLLKPLFPFLFASHPCLGQHVCQTRAEWFIGSWFRDFKRRTAVLHPKASWRRMLPVQPAAPIDGAMIADYYELNEVMKNSLEFCEVDSSKHAPTLTAGSNLGQNATMGLLYDLILHFYTWPKYIHKGVYVQWNMFKYEPPPGQEYLGFHSPQKWVFFCTPTSWPDSSLHPKHYQALTPRNTITIHVSDVRCGDGCKWRQNSAVLTRLVRLPEGVLRTDDKANRYTLGNLFRSYEIWGRLPQGLKSDLEIERSGKTQSEIELELMARYREDRADSTPDDYF